MNNCNTKRPETQTHLANAIRYALAGWPIIPLVPGEKRPMVPNGVHDATTDVETIAAWWRSEPHANIGLALNDSLVVLDIDPRHGGTLDMLGKISLDPSDTVMATTGGGGWHVIYQKPTSATMRSKLGLLPGIDILSGAGRYIVAAPSMVGGRPYKWVRSPVDIDPLRMPLGVVERLKAPQTPQDDTKRAVDGGGMGYDLATVEAALGAIDPWTHGYHWWIRILMAIHDSFPDADGLAIATNWADGAPGEVAAKWPGFEAGGGMSVGTIIHYAREAGWRPASKKALSRPDDWRITEDDWRSCPVCAAQHVETYSDGSIRQRHWFCRQPSCRVYRKVRIAQVLAPLFDWDGVSAEIVAPENWRRWREDANAQGFDWRGIPLAGGERMALRETDTGGDPRHAVLASAGRAIMAKPAGRNVSAPRNRQRKPAEATERPERAHSTGLVLVSNRGDQRRLWAILRGMGVNVSRGRHESWRTEPLSDARRSEVIAALRQGNPFNSAMYTTGPITTTKWGGDLPHTEAEAVRYSLRNRVFLDATHILQR